MSTDRTELSKTITTAIQNNPVLLKVFAIFNKLLNPDYSDYNLRSDVKEISELKFKETENTTGYDDGLESIRYSMEHDNVAMNISSYVSVSSTVRFRNKVNSTKDRESNLDLTCSFYHGLHRIRLYIKSKKNTFKIVVDSRLLNTLNRNESTSKYYIVAGHRENKVFSVSDINQAFYVETILQSLDINNFNPNDITDLEAKEIIFHSSIETNTEYDDIPSFSNRVRKKETINNISTDIEQNKFVLEYIKICAIITGLIYSAHEHEDVKDQ